MAKKLVFATHKGGAGKSTLSVQCAAELGRLGYKVLLLDLDPQANSSIHVGYDHPSTVEYTIADVLRSDNDLIKDAIHARSRFKNVSLVYSSIELGQVEDSLRENSMRPNEEIKAIVENVEDQFDVIIFDTPPSLKLLTTNALVSADFYIIPIESGSQYAMYGLVDVEKHSSRIRNSLNPKLKFLGGILVKHDKRLNVCQIVESAVKDSIDKLIPIFIPSSTVVNQAAMLKTSVNDVNSNSKVAREFKKLAKYLVEEMGLKK